LLSIAATAQTQTKPTNSYFDDSESKELAVKSILVQGEVRKAGQVNLVDLPIRSVAYKEVGIENGKQVFKGAFFVSGYSPYDILDSMSYKKAQENTFNPPVDLYAIVENEKARRLYSVGVNLLRNSFDILVQKPFSH
jgi:hypothetical protein